MTIRRTPADFIVAERPTAKFTAALVTEFSPQTTHVVYKLDKTSLTTPDAVQRFAQAMKAKPGSVDYAGLKDKHAQTSQHVSLPIASADDAAVKIRPSVGESAWSATFVGFSPVPCTAETIDGNAFRIIIRDLAKGAVEEMDLRAERLRHPNDPANTLVFTNYFGAQRFGSARHNHGFIAKHLCTGEFETALKLSIGTPARKDHGHLRQFTRVLASNWPPPAPATATAAVGATSPDSAHWKNLLPSVPKCPERAAVERLAAGGTYRDAFSALPYFSQQMAVEAFQSHLWNEVVRRLVRRLAIQQAPAPAFPAGAPRPEDDDGSPRPRKGALISSDDQFGIMLFPIASIIANHWRELIVPMAAPEAKLDNPAVRDITLETLADEQLTLDQLTIPGLRRPTFGPATRPLFSFAQDVVLTPPEPDDLSDRRNRFKREMAFRLPRGSYATVLLRALGQ